MAPRLSLSSVVALDFSRDAFSSLLCPAAWAGGGGIGQNFCCGPPRPWSKLFKDRGEDGVPQQNTIFGRQDGRQRMGNLCVILPVLLIRSYC